MGHSQRHGVTANEETSFWQSRGGICEPRSANRKHRNCTFDLDHPNIDILFTQMGRKAMAQMRRRPLGKMVSHRRGSVAGARGPARRRGLGKFRAVVVHHESPARRTWLGPPLPS